MTAGEMPAGEGPKAPSIRRILSIDGAGVYGLISAIWLRQMCERDPNFLAPGQVDLFAGISSGAVNALLLAKSKDPRAAVLSGELEAFWRERRGVFSNPMPVSRALSWFGLTPWYDANSFLRQLEGHFGQLTLGDLPNKVLVSTFNWTGQRSFEFSTWPKLARPDPLGRRSWQPKLFCTLEDTSDARYRVVDIAYGAAAPPGFRPIRGGIGDAGTFTGNPSVEAIAAMARSLAGWPAVGEQGCTDCTQGANDAVPETVPVHELDRISLLSIGDGSCEPSYWLQSFGLGSVPMALLPTNPSQGAWFSPVWEVSIQAPVADASHISRMLLVDRFHRLDADLMELPMLLASLFARNLVARDAVFRHIEDKTRSDLSQRVVSLAAAYLNNGWREPWKDRPAALRERLGVLGGSGF